MKTFHLTSLAATLALSTLNSLSESPPTAVPETERTFERYSAAWAGAVECRTEAGQRWTRIPGAAQLLTLSVSAGDSTPVDDFIIVSGPAPSVTAALNFVLTGDLQAYIVRASNGVEVASQANLRLDIGLLDRTFSGQVLQSSTQATNGAVSGVQTSTALLAPYSGIGKMTGKTPELVLPVGVPVRFRMSLNNASEVTVRVYESPRDISVWAFAKAAHAVSLPTRGPVFDLPEGFTVRSVSGAITDNQYSPSLEIFKDGSGMVVRWPGSPGEFVLESASGLSQEAEWVIETSVVSQGGKCTHIADLSAGRRFYRLRR